MTIDEFHVMAGEPGWKYEYWDGKAHVSPAHWTVTTSLNTERRSYRYPCQIRPVESRYQPGMIDAFVAAFRDAIEYCDWEDERILDSARNNVTGFFSGERGHPLPASRLALVSQPEGERESVVGAALVIGMRGGSVLLDVLFVTPEWQRVGVATALVSSVTDQLHDSGHSTLKSRYNLGNDASRAWHRKFGFAEDSDLFLAESYCRHAEHELWRREKLGDLTREERRKLMLEIERWRAQADELSALAARVSHAPH
ncbi:MAG: GNAT family N-acetyltransferase [Spirochaetaceae bacterium]|nr:GNAT family N-acetyltransferase [Spirochaetaceae bacterium]